MTIQPSVVIWTVICFLLLCLVLKNLLFKPVFGVLDKRKEKLAAARKKQEQIAAIEAEHKLRLSILEEDAKIQRENFINSELKLIRIKSKTELDEAKSGRHERLEAARLASEKEKEEIKASFHESSDAIVKAFAEQLIK